MHVLKWQDWWLHPITKWPAEETLFFLYLPCRMKCLILISWWPTFCVLLWAKTGSLTLMFNSVFVFDERFCLDWDPQGGTSVANIYALPVKESRLEQQVSSLSVGIQSQKIFSLPWEVQKSPNHPKQAGPVSVSDIFFWMRRAEWWHYEIT